MTMIKGAIEKSEVKELLDKDVIETIIYKHKMSTRVMDACLIEVDVIAQDDSKHRVIMSVDRRNYSYRFMNNIGFIEFKELKFPFQLYNIDDFRDLESEEGKGVFFGV